MEVTAHKGGNQGEEGAIRWLTTDRQHAAGFGAVSTYRVRCDDDRVGHYTLDDLADRRPEVAHGGLEAEEAMKEIVDEDGHWIAAIEGWEGRGLCLWIARPDAVIREGEDAKSFRSYIHIEEVD